MHPSIESANIILTRNLLGAAVESFGLAHQSLYIEFRDGQPLDHTLSIDTDISSDILDADCIGFSVEEKALLLLSRVNLRAIIRIHCSDDATLTIEFDNGRNLIFSGLPTDKTCIEPWQMSSNESVADGGYQIIAFSGGGCAIFSQEEQL